MNIKPQFEREKIMVRVRALVCAVVMLWAGTGQAALVYLDANFASDTVAEDSTGLNVVETLTATSSGVVWGGQIAQNTLFRIENGNYETFSVPSPGVGAVRMQNINTVLMGTYYVGSLSGSAKVYQVDSTTGAVTDFITLPASHPRVLKMSVSPTSGDILVNADTSGDDRLLKYDSAGNLQWNVAAPPSSQAAVAYTPSGQAIVNGENGLLYSIDNATGALSLLSAVVPTEFEWGSGYIHDMVFSNDENLFTAITSNNNHVEIFRTNINTGVSDMLAHWDTEIPLTERWLEYVDGQGLYLNSFNAADLELPSELGFGLSLGARSFSLESSSAGVLLLQGDFNGDFAGFSLQSLTPEPGSAWLLLGLLAWKRKSLANRTTSPEKDSR